MIEKPDFTSFNSAELFVLSRLVQLRADDCGPYLPSWVVELPLGEKPYSLNEEAVGTLLKKLAEADLLAVEPEEKAATEAATDEGARSVDAAEEGEAEASDAEAPFGIAASNACMSHLESLRQEVARRSPPLPDDLPSLLLLADANRSPAGFSSDEIMRALESPPGRLTRAQGLERYRALMDAHWIFACDREREATEWFPAPSAWALSQEILRRLDGRAAEMRESLALGIAASLGLGAESHLHTALQRLDRRMFVSDDFAHLAYRDRPVPIWVDTDRGFAVTTSSPGVCALIAHALELSLGDRVLVCGVKGGFTAALCAHAVGPRGRVICLDDRPEVVDIARAAIERAGLSRRVEIRLVRDVTVGLELQEPWDAVVVNGKIPKVPRPIIRQMREGGRLLLFIQNVEDNAQTAYLVRKNGSAVENKAMSTFLFTPIYGEYGFDPPNWQENLNLVGQEGHDVFVSYSTRDQADCNRIVATLEVAGIRCWQSARDHPVGKDGYEAAIMNALQRAQLFLLVLSHNSVESDHVQNELTNATNLKKPMLPVKLEECPMRLPPRVQYHVERHQQFDLAHHHIDKVTEAALQLLGDHRKSAASPALTPQADPKELDETLEFVLRDGRVSRYEMLLLLEQARRAWPDSAEAALRTRIHQRAREQCPDVTFDC